MIKSVLVLASAGALSLGIPLAGVSGSTTITAGAQGHFEQWMRQVSLDVSFSGSARVNVMLKAANQDGMTALTAITHHHRGMAYQESSAMAKAMLTAESWWQQNHLTAGSSDAAGLGTSLKTLAAVKTKLMAEGWWNSSSRLGRAMTEASITGAALLHSNAQGTSTVVQTHNSSQGRLASSGTTQGRSSDHDGGSVAGRASTQNSSASNVSNTTSTASTASRSLTVRPHSGFEANLGLSGQARAHVGNRGDLSPAASNPQLQSATGLQVQTTVKSSASVLGQLGF